MLVIGFREVREFRLAHFWTDDVVCHGAGWCGGVVVFG
jgi:hypothetical protein